jgi:hypothetical protein
MRFASRSLPNGTTHALFGREVEQKLRNLMAVLGTS